MANAEWRMSESFTDQPAPRLLSIELRMANRELRMRKSPTAASHSPFVIRHSPFLVIFVEPSPLFPSQPPRVDHLHQQRAWPVLGISKPLLEHAQDVHTDIQADEVGQGERSHRVIHPQLHNLVDGLRLPDSLVKAKNRLVDHRHEHPVGYE